jgi:uncharacterized circularly permuted ATP-grasp superfamily protein
VKQTDASGGYGMLIGPNLLKEQQEFVKNKHNPRNYIAQPMINLPEYHFD